MDNVSNALIVAGSVIIVLLIISVSMVFVNQSGSFIGFFSSNITETQVSDHNNTYSIYEGQILGAEVINVANRIVINNNSDRLVGMTIKVRQSVGENYYTITPGDSSQLGLIIEDIVRTKVYTGKTILNDLGLIYMIVFD